MGDMIPLMKKEQGLDRRVTAVSFKFLKSPPLFSDLPVYTGGSPFVLLLYKSDVCVERHHFGMREEYE